MRLKDSLGVPLEPEYAELISTDLYGDDIYSNSTVYINANDLLLEENLERYTKEYVEKLTAGEANEVLREVMLPSEYSEVVKEALFAWVSDNGYAKFFDLQPKRGADIVDPRRNH